MVWTAPGLFSLRGAVCPKEPLPPGNLRLGLPLLLRGVAWLDVPAGTQLLPTGISVMDWQPTRGEGCKNRVRKGRSFLSSYFVT